MGRDAKSRWAAFICGEASVLRSGLSAAVHRAYEAGAELPRTRSSQAGLHRAPKHDCSTALQSWGALAGTEPAVNPHPTTESLKHGQKPLGNGERAAPGLQSDPPGGAPPRSGGEALLEAVITRPALFMG